MKIKEKCGVHDLCGNSIIKNVRFRCCVSYFDFCCSIGFFVFSYPLDQEGLNYMADQAQKMRVCDTHSKMKFRAVEIKKQQQHNRKNFLRIWERLVSASGKNVYINSHTYAIQYGVTRIKKIIFMCWMCVRSFHRRRRRFSLNASFQFSSVVIFVNAFISLLAHLSLSFPKKKNKNYWLRSVRSKTHTNTQQTHTTWVENHFHLKNTTRKHFCEGNKMMKTVVFLFWKCYHKNVSNIPNSFFIIFILFSWAFSSVSLSNFTVFQTKIVLHILLLFQSLNHLKWCERFDLSLSRALLLFFLIHFPLYPEGKEKFENLHSIAEANVL